MAWRHEVSVTVRKHDKDSDSSGEHFLVKLPHCTGNSGPENEMISLLLHEMNSLNPKLFNGRSQ